MPIGGAFFFFFFWKMKDEKGKQHQLAFANSIDGAFFQAIKFTCLLDLLWSKVVELKCECFPGMRFWSKT